MRVTGLELTNFRNLTAASLVPCEGVNVIFGENAQGKTNLLEAIWLCSGGRSFRGSRESQMIQFQQEAFRVGLSFADREREQQIWYQSAGGDRKKIQLNGVPLRTSSELAGEFLSVIFHPGDLSIVQEGPAARRTFLDNAISQIKPIYAKYLAQYNSVLEQRGALLRQLAQTGKKAGLLEIWDEQLACMGTAISIFRQDYLQKLSRVSSKIYGGFSDFEEEFSLCYESSVFPAGTPLEIYDDALIQQYRTSLQESLETDIRMRSTTRGIHRDDMDLKVNGLSARLYGSQGQQRSCAIALKLGEAALLREITGENPVILLDDVMSELDQGRQDYLLNRIKGFQVFITCCDVVGPLRMEQGKVFRVTAGQVEEISLEDLAEQPATL